MEFTFTSANVKKEIKRALGMRIASAFTSEWQRFTDLLGVMVPDFAVCGTTVPCTIRP